MKNKTFAYIFLFFTVILLTACQAIRPAGVTATNASVNAIAPTIVEPSPSPQAIVEATISEPNGQIPPTDSPAAKVEKEVTLAAEAYFTAVSEGNSETAADLLSSFSLMVFQMTRGDAVDALQAQKIAGLRWSDLKILDVQMFDEQTVLVHVTYSETDKSVPTPTATPKTAAEATPAPTQTATSGTVDALWSMRLEQGEWHYNWNNVIDFRTLDVDAQTTSGITILPTQLTRYSDRIELSMLIQNRTNETVVFGQVNETLGTFYFGDQPVVAERTQWILNPLRSVPHATLVIKGLFHSYPDTVEIRKWNNYDVEPWYIFQVR